MTIQYRVLVDPEDKKQYKAAVKLLFHRAFGRPLSDVDWRHFINDSPYEPGCCVVSLDGDRVVGTANLIPQRLRIGAETLDYALFTTSMVDPDYRKQGVYLRTTRLAVETARAAQKTFILAFPNEMHFRPLTTLFPFKPFADVRIVSGTLDEVGDLRSLDQDRSLRLDDDFVRWRFDHRAYFRVPYGGKILVCKEYLGAIDIVEVLIDPPVSLRERLPERDVRFGQVNVLSSRRTGSHPCKVLATWQATCCLLRKDVELPEIDISLLMWDIV